MGQMIIEITKEADISESTDIQSLKEGDSKVYVLPSGEYIEHKLGLVKNRASIKWLKQKKKDLAENIEVLQAEKAKVQAMLDALPKKDD